MTPEVRAAIDALVAVTLVGAFGTALVMWVARRSVPVASALVPVIVVAATGTAVATAVHNMLLERDLKVVIAILLAVSSVAIAMGLWLSALTRRLVRGAAEASAQQQAALELERARRSLIAGVSHDLRTPLAGIRAITEALEDGVQPPAEGLAKVRSLVLTVDQMVADLLELSQLQSAPGQGPRGRVDLRDIVSDAVATVALSVRGDGPRLAGDPGGPVVVLGDGRQLARVVDNLVANAVRHSPAASDVAIELAVSGGVVCLSVSDACGGIASDDLPHLFEAGFRAGSARTPSRDQGAGLGLAIVREIVRAHGGTVTVVNAGVGCRFDVTLPLSDA